MNIVSEMLATYQKSYPNDYAMVVASQSGVSPSVINDVLDITGFSPSFLAEQVLSISPKTLQRYQRDQQLLSPKVSESLLKLLQLFRKGIELFGDSSSYKSWLKKSAFGLGGLRPIDLLQTTTGMTLIMDELIRIEYGALA